MHNSSPCMRASWGLRVSPLKGVFINVVCAVNVLYNRKATLSSNAAAGAQACTAVDGEGERYCFRTADYDKAPYWEVEMEDAYSITGCKIFWRHFKCKIF